MLVRRSLKVEVSRPILPKAFLSNTLALQCEHHKVYDLPDFQAHTLHSLNNKPCCVADGPELRSILPVAGPSFLYWRRGSNGGFRTVRICQRFVLGFRQAMVGGSQYRPQNTIILSIGTPESTPILGNPNISAFNSETQTSGSFLGKLSGQGCQCNAMVAYGLNICEFPTLGALKPKP